MRKTNISVTVWKEGKFRIYVFDDGDFWDCWLGYEMYGVMDHMFGLPKDTTTLSEAYKIVQSNLQDYMMYFLEDHEELI